MQASAEISQEKKEEVGIQDLPQETLYHIFSFFNKSELDKIKPTCRDFYNISKDPFIQSHAVYPELDYSQPAQTGHRKTNHIALTPCFVQLADERVITNYLSKEICISDLKNNHLLKEFLKHADHISCIIVLLEDRIITGDESGAIRVCDIKNEKCIMEMKANSSVSHSITALAMLSANELVSVSNKTISIWDISNGKCIKNYVHDFGDFPITCLATNTEQNVIVCGLSEWLVVHDRKGKTSTTFALDSEVNCVNFPSKDELVIGTKDGKLYIWGSRNKEINVSIGINCIATLTPDQVVIGCMDGTLKIYNISTGTCVHTLTGHTAPVTSVSLLSTKEIMSASLDGSLRIWSFQPLNIATIANNSKIDEPASNSENTNITNARKSC